MGLFSWLAPSPEKKLERARRLIEGGDFLHARDAVEGIDGEEAERLKGLAIKGLRDLNIREAVGLANAGEFERAEEHLELAESFNESDDGELQRARREVRQLRVAAPVVAGKAGAGCSSDPFGGGGCGGPAEGAGADPTPKVDENNLWSLPPDDPRLAVAMTLESYPKEIREKLIALGGEFATAMAMIDQGDPKGAVEALSVFIEREPAVRFERARAARAAGMLPLASSDLATFGAEIGHMKVGVVHTAALLAQVYAEQGRVKEALSVTIAQLKIEPKHLQLRGTLASLLEAVGRYEEADEVARSLVRDVPKDLGLYRLMARCRIRGGKRHGAMQVLESGLKSNCTTGTCGAQPFDVESGRMLARLYFEDRLAPKRAVELLRTIERNAKEASWFDDYLRALEARNGSPADLTMGAELLASIPEGDPRRGIVEAAFPEVAAS